MLSAISRERWREIEPLLDAVLDLEPDRRSAFLNTACDSNPALRAEVERLLRSCERAQELLPKPAAEACASLLAGFTAPDTAVGSRIGPYRIVGEAGCGGMGTVYVAERADDQFRKRVALKLVRRGLDEPHLMHRFLEERQILASLDHPHIACLLDGGVTPEGLPWFAMEYVDGLPIDRYCDEHRLSIERRLRLFLDVCEAVQYAHRNLVVHRDLKPSNILVTGAGEVKLLDFGIAKLLAPSDAPGETLTRTGLRVMTPDYASPEQVRGDVISTASDVYSLGVVLYELLTGKRPYRLGGRSPHEIERAILQEHPERPSAAAGHGGADSAAARGMTPDWLCRHLRGDLDTIVLTAIRKEPDRRYATAEQLAADVRRHLDGLPVTARRDTWRYRAGKFVRRHPAGVSSAAAFVLLLSGSSVVTVVQSARTARERDKAEQISTFIVDLLRAPDPSRGRGGAVTVRELLDSAVARIDRELIGQPELRAELLSVMGRSYWGLGLPDRSRPILDSAIALRQRTGGDAVDLLQDQASAGRMAFEESDYVAAESLGRASLATGRRLFGERHPNLTSALLNLGYALRNIGRDAEAESLLIEAVAIQRTQPRDSILSLATALASLASSRWARADWTGADTLYREALALRRESLGDEHPDVGGLYVYLGAVIRPRSNPSAEGFLRRGLDIQRRALGEDHPLVAEARRYLADNLAGRGELAPAESLYRAALVTWRRIYPARIWDLAGTLTGLGSVALERGDARSAERILREALGVYEKDGPPGQRWLFAEIPRLLGTALAGQGKYAEAEKLLLESLATRSTKWGARHEWTLDSIRGLISLYEAWGKPEKAREYRARLE